MHVNIWSRFFPFAVKDFHFVIDKEVLFGFITIFWLLKAADEFFFFNEGDPFCVTKGYRIIYWYSLYFVAHFK